MKLKKALFSLILALGILSVPMASAQDNDAEVIGGDEAALRHLLSFFTASPHAQDPRPAAIYIGQVMPDGLFEAPLPPDSIVIGSIDSPRESELPRPDQLLYETPLSPQEVIAFYADNLGDAFQESPLNLIDYGGFILGVPHEYINYCYNESEGSLNIYARPHDGGSRVILTIDEADGSPFNGCSSGEVPLPQFENLPVMPPKLTTPEGVEIFAGYSDPDVVGAQSLEASPQVTLVTDTLTAQDLLNVFSEQVSAQEWTIASSEGTPDGALLTFTKTQDEQLWGGMLTIIRNPAAENHFNAYVTVYLGE